MCRIRMVALTHVDGVRRSSNQRRESTYPLCVNKLRHRRFALTCAL